METMLILQNAKYNVFFARGEEEKAKEMRMTDPRMKYARIFECLQAYPSQVEYYHVYSRIGADDA